jgi:hypothetical protein
MARAMGNRLSTRPENLVVYADRLVVGCVGSVGSAPGISQNWSWPHFDVFWTDHVHVWCLRKERRRLAVDLYSKKNTHPLHSPLVLFTSVF